MFKLPICWTKSFLSSSGFQDAPAVLRDRLAMRLVGTNSASFVEMTVGAPEMISVPVWGISCLGGSVPLDIGMAGAPGTGLERLSKFCSVFQAWQKKMRTCTSNMRYLHIFSCSLVSLLLTGFIPAGWFLLQKIVAFFGLHPVLPCQISSLSLIPLIGALSVCLK